MLKLVRFYSNDTTDQTCALGIVDKNGRRASLAFDGRFDLVMDEPGIPDTPGLMGLPPMKMVEYSQYADCGFIDTCGNHHKGDDFAVLRGLRDELNKMDLGDRDD